MRRSAWYSAALRRSFRHASHPEAALGAYLDLRHRAGGFGCGRRLFSTRYGATLRWGLRPNGDSMPLMTAPFVAATVANDGLIAFGVVMTAAGVAASGREPAMDITSAPEIHGDKAHQSPAASGPISSRTTTECVRGGCPRSMWRSSASSSAARWPAFIPTVYTP